MGTAARAAPGDILFNEDFDAGGVCDTLAPDWSTTSTNLAGIGTQTSQSGPCSLFTRGDVVTVTGPVVDLSGITGAELALWIRQGDDAFSEDVDAGEDFVVEYLDSSNVWTEILTEFGAGPDGGISDLELPLAAGALHAGFRLRVRQTGGNGGPPSNGGIGFDYWHLDDVVITETGTPPPPPGQAALGLNQCDDFETGFGNWTTTVQSQSGISQQTANSPSRSMFLNGQPVTTTSLPFSTIGVDTIDVWIRRGDNSFSEFPDGGEDLRVEYLTSTGTWVLLDTFVGGTSGGEIFEPTYTLPPAGQHANFQIRFVLVTATGANFDFWHIDDLCFSGPVPSLTASKSVTIEQDPVNGTTDPYSIPNAWAIYAITVTNTGAGTVDAGSIVLADDIDDQLTLFAGDLNGAGSPFRFIDGAGGNASGLSLNFGGLGNGTDGVTFEDAGGGSITPLADFDPLIRRFVLQLDGAMNGATGGSTPTFTIEYRVRID